MNLNKKESNSNLVFKGWILIHEETNTNSIITSSTLVPSLNSINFKWIPKFAVLNKQDKLLMLFDYEPVDTQITTSQFMSNLESATLCRMDNSIDHDSFLSYWRNKSSCKFELIETFNNRDRSETTINHHLSNRDIETIDNESSNKSLKQGQNAPTLLGSTAQNNNENFVEESPSSNGAFRFAGLFFKKDKSEKKHSSLKRAKSGIQLERKKTVPNGTISSVTNKTLQFPQEQETKNNLPSPIRPSRSHESLATPVWPSSYFSRISQKSNRLDKSSAFNRTVHEEPFVIEKPKSVDTWLKMDLNNEQQETVLVQEVHNSLLNEENCFQIQSIGNSISIIHKQDSLHSNSEHSDTYDSYKYYCTSECYTTRYFMCRSSEEKDKWIECLRSVVEPDIINLRHNENSIQLWILEAKGQSISTKTNKKYFCEIFLDKNLYARTCFKSKKDILFWGENFDFNSVKCEHLRVELYQQNVETQKKKIKVNQTMLGYIKIPVSDIEMSQPIEKWYKLETSSDTSSNYSSSTYSNKTDANQTTQNFSKDSISIRIKAKYQSVDILPLASYERLINYLKSHYLDLMLKLEPNLNVRVKDDLANSLIKISHKLQMHTQFLCDLVLAEVLQLEDASLTFRGNSLATKAMESYMKLVGESYLKHTLSDCVRSIIETSHDLEIDPSKCTIQSNLTANREELVQILHLVCGRVFNSCINFPNEMKKVFALLRSECKRNGRTDEMCDTLISASIFLRFICPAILSPNLFNLTQEYPQEKAARKLTLVAKTLQTIANFSKFGGKEFYMSFDKMNQFVDEHTCLMREFLRNISTLEPKEESQIESTNQVCSSVSLTPETPNLTQTHTNGHVNNLDAEVNFQLELNELSKQLSILHTLLTSIVSGFDENQRMKFDMNELLDILNEINEMKQTNRYDINVESNLYSYENRLHQAIKTGHTISKQQAPSTLISRTKSDHNINSSSESPITPSTPKTNASTPTSTCPNSDANSNQPNSQESNLFEQVVLNNIINETGLNKQQKLEHEINLLKQKLRETELTLKKEQTEKYLVEYKLKQQQQENDQQMRNIINRLIKVEEELRKEQNEMHKLLKAKQDLIEIQKKRIEYLTKRSNLPSSNSTSQMSNAAFLNTTTHQVAPQLKLNRQVNRLNTNNVGFLPSSINASISNPSLASEFAQTPLTTQIAASPSSSSSSMTQFLANNNMINKGDLNKIQKLKLNAVNLNNHFLHNDHSNSSTSSASSTLSSLSNNNNPHIHQQPTSHQQLPPNYQSIHFLRTSEL